MQRRVYTLEGPLAVVVVILALVLGLVLAVWLLASSIVLALLLPLVSWLYYGYLRLVRRYPRLPGGWKRRP